jgi:hypothetical protein
MAPTSPCTTPSTNRAKPVRPSTDAPLCP